jgi:hypothetical protein
MWLSVQRVVTSAASLEASRHLRARVVCMGRSYCFFVSQRVARRSPVGTLVVRRWTYGEPSRRCFAGIRRICTAMIGLVFSALGSQGAVPCAGTRDRHFGTVLTRPMTSQSRRRTTKWLGETQNRSQAQDGHQSRRTRAKRYFQSSDHRRAPHLSLSRIRRGYLLHPRIRCAACGLAGMRSGETKRKRILAACDDVGTVGTSVGGPGRS